MRRGSTGTAMPGSSPGLVQPDAATAAAATAATAATSVDLGQNARAMARIALLPAAGRICGDIEGLPAVLELGRLGGQPLLQRLGGRDAQRLGIVADILRDL